MALEVEGVRNPRGWTGDTGEILAGLHFKYKGYAISWPDVDVGYDFVAIKGDEYIRVQVKTLTGESTVPVLSGRGRGGDYTYNSEEAAAESLMPRRFDVLAIVHDPHIWTLPAIVTKGKTGINVLSIESKYHVHREELAYGRRTPQALDTNQGREIRSGEGPDDRP